ncbi:hypothetical protein KCZ48_03035 [Lactiplantibacillus plantarum]|uniref:hypothetical protein n=1 Tax=Lactiplantibacillus plantarum TaxID=1590 RepID=UPI00200CCFEE|nr:hypothetical protein [Lactiplantibacillus plantarum]UQB61731.1 hypothetical protein KCZ48_03035 [Lactiplantibacillus plantarum]
MQVLGLLISTGASVTKAVCRGKMECIAMKEFVFVMNNSVGTPVDQQLKHWLIIRVEQAF